MFGGTFCPFLKAEVQTLFNNAVLTYAGHVLSDDVGDHEW
jgi:hypothetical protein